MNRSTGRPAREPDSDLGTLPNAGSKSSASGPKEWPLYSFLSPPVDKDEIGRLGMYRIRKLLGKGGMGMVFLAEDLSLCRPVALKVIKPSLQTDAQAWPRFLREARAMAAIKNDHLVTVYQVGQEGQTIFLAMELLEGRTLESWIEHHPQPKLLDIIRLAREAALGLEAMHGRGLIHRDLKPSNLWVEAPSGRLKILDFGLVRDTSKADLETQLTGSGVLLGTPAFWSPEQARGKTADARSDLFSLGCVFYRLCTRQYAFPGSNTLDQLAAVTADDPTPVHQLNPSLPLALADLVMQLLSKDPEKRPQTAAEVASRLQQIKRGLSNRTRRTKEPDTARLPASVKARSRAATSKPLPRRRWLKVGVALGAFAVASVLAVGMARLLGGTQAGDPAPAQVKDAAAASKGALGAGKVFLRELTRSSTVNWPFHKPPKGDFAKGPPPELYGSITVKGQSSPNGIFMHPAPPNDYPASITYNIQAQFHTFSAKVSLNDSSPFVPSPISFSVYGDGKLLWRSQPVICQNDSQPCTVSIVGVTELKLETMAAGDVRKAHAVWVEPHVVGR